MRTVRSLEPSIPMKDRLSMRLGLLFVGTFLAVFVVLAAWAMRRRKASTLARVSFLSGLAVILGFFGGAAFSSSSAGLLGIWFSVVVGWTWLAIVSLHLYRVALNPALNPNEARG